MRLPDWVPAAGTAAGPLLCWLVTGVAGCTKLPPSLPPAAGADTALTPGLVAKGTNAAASEESEPAGAAAKGSTGRKGLAKGPPAEFGSASGLASSACPVRAGAALALADGALLALALCTAPGELGESNATGLTWSLPKVEEERSIVEE